MQDINIEKAKQEFSNYVDNFDLEDESIRLKKFHSLRVMQISSKLAKEEGFSKEEVTLATLIGLLHDIARFKQHTEYKTFNDFNSFDHGNVGAELLEKDNFLRKFIETTKYDEIIKIAIRNHNKFEIEDGLTEEQIKFCKLIRDADKIDILFEAIEYFLKKQVEETENSKINPEVKKDFDEHKVLKREKYKKIQYADRVIQFLGFIFDINYKSSFKIIKEEHYIDKIVNQFNFKDEETQKQMWNARDEVNNYIEIKLKQ